MMVDFMMDISEYQQYIRDCEATMSQQGKEDYSKHAAWLYEKMGADTAKLAILLIAHPQVAATLARKPN